MRARRRADIGWALVVLFSVFAIAPLLAPGFFLKAHDATIGAYMLWQFSKGMADGAMYPRWAIDWTFGYGYPVFLVIAPLAFYAAQAVHLLGASIIGSMKVVYGLSFLLSGLAMYLFARQVFGRAGGLLAAVLYVYIPYHLVDIYVRADIAEFVSYAFFPAILWAMLRLSRAQQRGSRLRYVALGGLLYGGLILTHITMAMVFTPVVVLYALLLAGRRPTQTSEVWETAEVSTHADSTLTPALSLEGRGRRTFLVLAACSLLLGIAISAAFLFPGFLEQRYLQARDLVGGYFGYAGHYVYPNQFLSPFWGYGYAAIGPDDQMPYQLGAIAVVLGICSLWAWPRLVGEGRRQLAFFLLMTAAVIFFMLSASQPLWDPFRPAVAFIQFPWRLLSLTSVGLALVGGALGAAGSQYVETKLSAGSAATRPDVLAWGQNAAPLLVVLVLLGSYAYVQPQYTDSDISLQKMIQFQLDTKELLGDTIWVTERPTTSPMVDEYLAGEDPTRAVPDDGRAQIEVLHRGGDSYEVLVTAPAATDVLFRIHYFPGWKAYVDGKLVETAIRSPQGLMAVAVPAGAHQVLLRFEDTPLRRASKLVTGLGLLVAAGLLLWAWRLDRTATRAAPAPTQMES